MFTNLGCQRGCPANGCLNAGTFSSINIIGPSTSSNYSGNGNVVMAYGSQINRVKLSSTLGVTENISLNAAFQTGSFNTLDSIDAASDKILLRKSLFGTI